MSDLPTREEVKRLTDDDYPTYINRLATLAAAYIDGRLVDREAIDYDAGAESFFDAGKLPGDPNPETWESVPEWVREEYRGHFRTALDAALGGDDE